MAGVKLVNLNSINNPFLLLSVKSTSVGGYVTGLVVVVVYPFTTSNTFSNHGRESIPLVVCELNTKAGAPVGINTVPAGGGSVVVHVHE